MVCDIGFEPMPLGPKPSTLPDYANHRLVLLAGIEPAISPYKGPVMPFNYRSIGIQDRTRTYKYCGLNAACLPIPPLGHGVPSRT